MARGIGEAGIGTRTITLTKDILELTGAPRILSLKFTPGKPLGNPGDVKTQRGIIEAGFDLLQKNIKEMTIVDLPFKLSSLGFI